jgi:hypothetical protein
MVRLITFGSLKVWIYLQQLYENKPESKGVTDINKFICYFKFSEPTVMVYGELVMDEDYHLPAIFDSLEDAEKTAIRYIEKKYNFKAWPAS